MQQRFVCVQGVHFHNFFATMMCKLYILWWHVCDILTLSISPLKGFKNKAKQTCSRFERQPNKTKQTCRRFERQQ